jgi:hypothetical protein
MKVRMTVISPLGTLDFSTVKINGEKLYFQKEIIRNSIVSIKILE